MRSAERARAIAITLLAAGTSLWSCDGGGPTAPPTVARVEVTAAGDTLTALGATVQFSAVARDAAGNAIPDQTFTWSSSATGVATVDETGRVTAVGDGATTITARTAGVAGSAGIQVSQEVATVAVTPSVDTVRVLGTSVQFSAAARDAGGSPVANVRFLWISSDQGVARVDTTGLVTATGSGEATITAAARGVPGYAVLRVVPVRNASLSAGRSHSCGLSTGGAAYCWGFNSSGQLGDGTTTSRLTPVAVAGGLSFASLTAGLGHTCGVTTGGAAYCWGENGFGRLGDGTLTDWLSPVAVVGGLSFASLSAGIEHTCGVTPDGGGYCWGRNLEYQLGDAAPAPFWSSPVAVVGGLSFVWLSPGFMHTCGITTDGLAYCWGENGSGQLGQGNIIDRSFPRPVAAGPLRFASLGSGVDHTCAVTTGGTAYCWGVNGSGQLGDGTSTNRLSSVAVVGGRSFLSLSAEASHTCGVTPDGVGYCWGRNSSGQLGDGTTNGSFIPVRVLTPGS